jgi:ribonuclease HI
VHHDPVALKVYVDGSCLPPNPGGPGGIAGIVEYPDDLNLPCEPILRTGYKSTTNNRMELRAAIEALRFISRKGLDLRVGRAVVFTDSTYVYNGARLTPYRRGGQSRNREGRPLDNRDLWRDFVRVRSQLRVWLKIELVAGKSTPILREVDKLAKQAAATPTEVDYGFRLGSIARSLTPGKKAARSFPANGQTATIRIYRVSPPYKAARQHKIFFDLFSPSEGDYAAKYFAYVLAQKEIHRNHCYVATFNRSPTYPVVDTLLELPKCPERRASLPPRPVRSTKARAASAWPA